MLGREIGGRYRIQAKLGEGGMGAVFKAEQISLKRTCAVKLLRPDVAGTAIMLRRFNAEAEAVAKLSHPNTVNIYDFGQDTDGSFFIAMEFIEGTSLREAINAEGPFSLRRALSIAVQVAASLVDAHGQSIIHRDLKPDNVMLQARGRSRDVARVLDFGIAKLRDEGRATQAAMTQAGDMLGTPQYMAPEQIRAEQIDGRTDIYALGCMMYEMVTARLPFEAPTIMALLSKHLLENPPPPSQRRPDLGIPPVIDELIMTAIAKDPNARPPNMEAFGERIGQILASLPADPHASAQQSAVVGVPLVTPTFQPQSPQDLGRSHAPLPPGTPPPGGYAPYAQPTPAAMGPYPGPGYATPPAGPPPYSFAPLPPHAVPASPPRSSTLLLILLATLAVIGGGVGIYFATRGAPAAQVAVVADATDAVEPVEPTEPVADQDVWAGGSAAKPTPIAVALAAMQDFKNQMCACKTAACATRVNDAMTKWGVEFAKVNGELETDPLDSIAEAYTECTAKAMAGTPPSPAAGDLTGKVEALAARACTCTEATCANQVMAELLVLAERLKAEATDSSRMEAAGQKLGQCVVAAGLDAQQLIEAMQQLGTN